VAVAPWIVSDELWELVEPLLPKREAVPLSGSEAAACSQGAAGDLVRAALRDRLAASATPARLRFGRDLPRERLHASAAGGRGS
jgi:hypothetical protein